MKALFVFVALLGASNSHIGTPPGKHVHVDTQVVQVHRITGKRGFVPLKSQVIVWEDIRQEEVYQSLPQPTHRHEALWWPGGLYPVDSMHIWPSDARFFKSGEALIRVKRRWNRFWLHLTYRRVVFTEGEEINYVRFQKQVLP